MRHAWTAVDRALLWLGAMVCAATIGLSVLALWLRTTSSMPTLPNRFGLTDPAMVGFVVLQVACAGVALVIVSRLPRNLIAWLLFGIGLGYAISILSAAVVYETASPGGAVNDPRLPWLTQTAAQVPGILTFVFVFVFPDVRLIASRTRLVGAAASLCIVISIASIAFHPGPLFFWPQVDNPFGFGPRFFLEPSGDLLPMGLLLGSIGLLGVAWIAWRYFTSTGIERLQLKWFVSASTVALAALSILVAVRGGPRSEDAPAWPLLVFALATTLVPISVGVAVLRYRLYDIDRIISRAIVYAALTGLLGVAYAVVITALGSLARLTLVGTGGGDTIIVAVSTLIVAALFNPLRRRIQSVVDRRFDRAGYDMTTIVDRFAEHARRTVDLEELETGVADVIGETLHPASVGVWLGRGGGR